MSKYGRVALSAGYPEVCPFVCNLPRVSASFSYLSDMDLQDRLELAFRVMVAVIRQLLEPPFEGPPDAENRDQAPPQERKVASSV